MHARMGSALVACGAENGLEGDHVGATPCVCHTV
jgi:hypothetical protein